MQVIKVVQIRKIIKVKKIKDQEVKKIRLGVQIRRFWVTRLRLKLEDKEMRKSHNNFKSFESTYEIKPTF